MPRGLLAVDGFGKLAFCSAHASCTGPSIFDLRDEDVLNTDPWVSTRAGLLDETRPVPPACEGCYTLTDPGRADM